MTGHRRQRTPSPTDAKPQPAPLRPRPGHISNRYTKLLETSLNR